MYKFTMYRDKIEINEKLRSTIMAAISKFDPADPFGRNILLAAREITIEPGYTMALTDCNLTMAGDLVDTSKGTIDISITVQALTGQAGNFGKSVGVICKSWGGIKVNLKGSTGGAGVMGQPGAHGKNGVSQPGKNNGGDGGKGGKGGTGCTGGMGGFVSAYFLNKLTPNATDLSGVVLDGGEGGRGGPGGPGGAGGSGEEWCKPNGTFCVMGTNGKQGPKGDPGVKGAKGVNGAARFSQVNMDDYMRMLRSYEVPLKEWADCRFTNGEYFFRAFNAENPDYLKMAVNEFDMVLNLDLQNTQASIYKNQILNNQNILGLARDLDVIPDFNRYEQVVNGYSGSVLRIFDAATNMLLGNIALKDKKTELELQLSSFTSLLGALQDDVKAAAAGEVASAKEFEMAKSRVDDITAQIQAKKVELENAHVDIAQAIIGTVGLVASLIAAIPTAGTSLVGAVTSIATIVDSVQKSGVLELISELAKPAEQQNAIKQLKKEAVGIQGYVKGAVNSIDTIVSFPKMLEELWTAKVDNEGYRKLIADSITLVHHQLLAKLRKTQAGFTSQAAQKRFDQGVINKAAAKTQLDGLQQEVSVLEKASLSLIKMAQHYMNILTEYAFFGARALEIYTLADKSQDIRYDYGYIHPDFEANYNLGLIPMASLLEQYNRSWGRFASLLDYRRQYDKYFETGDWIPDYHRMSFKDRILLSQFKSKPRLDFTIRLEDLPSSRFEAKVESVYVAFIGGKSKPQNITAIVEHSGRYEEKKRDGSKFETSLKSRAGVVSAKLTPLQSDGGIGLPKEMDFRGRGLAADYHLYIEADEIKNSGVDLSGLIEIQVWIQYHAFLLPAPVTGSHMIEDGLLLQDEEDGRMYVTYGSAKMPVAHTASLASLGLKEPAIDRQKSKELVSLLSTVPVDNTLFREERSNKMYVIKKGLKLEVPGTAELHRLGLDISDLKEVPETALNMLPYGGIAE